MSKQTDEIAAAEDAKARNVIRIALLERPKNTSELMGLLHLTKRQVMRHLSAMRQAGEVSHPVETGRGPRWMLRQVPLRLFRPAKGTSLPHAKAPAPKKSWWLAACAVDAPRGAFYAALTARQEGAEWQLAPRCGRQEARSAVSATPGTPDGEIGAPAGSSEGV